MRFRFDGANQEVAPEGVTQLSGVTHYLGSNGSVTGVPSYASVLQREIYEGIDAVYRLDQGNVVFDITIHPHGQLHRLRLHYDAECITVDKSGNLRINAGGHVEVIQKRPLAYKATPIGRVFGPAHYQLKADHTVAIRTGKFDPKYDLVIDHALVDS